MKSVWLSIGLGAFLLISLILNANNYLNDSSAKSGLRKATSEVLMIKNASAASYDKVITYSYVANQGLNKCYSSCNNYTDPTGFHACRKGCENFVNVNYDAFTYKTCQ